jgi:hypothetical protein
VFREGEIQITCRLRPYLSGSLKRCKHRNLKLFHYIQLQKYIFICTITHKYPIWYTSTLTPILPFLITSVHCSIWYTLQFLHPASLDAAKPLINLAHAVPLVSLTSVPSDQATDISFVISLPLGHLDKLYHALDNLVRHPRQRHVWQMLAVALSSCCSRVPEHMRLLHELVCQPGRVRRLGVGHSSRGRQHKVMSRLSRLFGDASRRVGGRAGGLQRLQRLARWIFAQLTRHLLRGLILKIGWRDWHIGIFSVPRTVWAF